MKRRIVPEINKICVVTPLEIDRLNYERYRLLDLRYSTTSYFFFPVLYPMHLLMEEECGTVDASGNVIKFPQALRLTCKSLENKGIYLLENGTNTCIWVGSEADPGMTNMVIKNEGPEQEYSKRFNQIIYSLQMYNNESTLEIL